MRARRGLVPILLVTAVVAGACSTGGSRGGGRTAGSSRAPAVEGVGREAWRWTAPAPAWLGMPAADGDAAAVTYGHQHLVVLDADGRVRWQADRLGLRDVAPRLTADLVLAATDDGVAAFDRATGAPRWDVPLGERANTPVVAGRLAVATTWEGSVIGLELAGGRVAWRTALPGASMGPADADASTVVATWEAPGRTGAGVVAIDAATGRQRWGSRVEAGGVSAPVLARAGLVVLVAGDLAAHGLALDSGAERWHVDVEGAGSPEVPPAPVGDAVLVAHRLGGLVLVDAASGRPSWRASTDGAVVRGGPVGGAPGGPFALALDDGRLLVDGPGRRRSLVAWDGRISGLALGRGGRLLVSGREAPENALVAFDGW
jgi:outer membrane protein assembly factor BamB